MKKLIQIPKFKVRNRIKSDAEFNNLYLNIITDIHELIHNKFQSGTSPHVIKKI